MKKLQDIINDLNKQQQAHRQAMADKYKLQQGDNVEQRTGRILRHPAAPRAEAPKAG
jgi:hypothetical protein